MLSLRRSRRPVYLGPRKMKSLAALVALSTALAVPANAVAVWGQCGVSAFLSMLNLLGSC